MSMHHMACYSVLIEIEEVRKVIPTEMMILENKLDAEGISLESLASAAYYDEEIEDVEEETSSAIFELLENAQKAFKEQTQISLYVGYESPDYLERGSDIDGPFFYLDWTDVMQETPKAKALREKGIGFDIGTWTTFG